MFLAAGGSLLRETRCWRWQSAANPVSGPNSLLAVMALPHTNDRTADVYALSLAMNATLERWIREQPESWLWLHPRWPKDPS